MQNKVLYSKIPNNSSPICCSVGEFGVPPQDPMTPRDSSNNKDTFIVLCFSVTPLYCLVTT